MNQQKCTEAWQVAAQQIAGADLAIEDPFEAVLAFAALQVKFGGTAAAARRLSSTVRFCRLAGCIVVNYSENGQIKVN